MVGFAIASFRRKIAFKWRCDGMVYIADLKSVPYKGCGFESHHLYSNKGNFIWHYVYHHFFILAKNESLFFCFKYWPLVEVYGSMMELADMADLESVARAWEFESLYSHYVIWFGIHLTHPSSIKLSCKILDGQMRWSDKNALYDIIFGNEQVVI